MVWKWTKVLIGVVVIGFWVIEGYAADALDKGPPSPDRNWQIGSTPSYSSGNFGTNTTSDFIYAPLSIRRLFKDGDVTLVIPFVTSMTDGKVTLVGGQPTQIQRPDNRGQGNNNPSQSVNCSDNSGQGNLRDRPECGGLTGRTAGQKVTTSGIGDIILRGRYYILEEKDYIPLIALTARMKFPTANEKQGLGTGAFDHGYGVEMSKLLGEKWIAFLDGGYNFIGDPDGLKLQNQYWYDVGAGYYITKNLLVSVYYEEYRSLVADLVNIRDFFFAFNYKASDALRFTGGVTVGVSNGAPDYVVSAGTSYRF